MRENRNSQYEYTSGELPGNRESPSPRTLIFDTRKEATHVLETGAVMGLAAVAPALVGTAELAAAAPTLAQQLEHGMAEGTVLRSQKSPEDDIRIELPDGTETVTAEVIRESRKELGGIPPAELFKLHLLERYARSRGIATLGEVINYAQGGLEIRSDVLARFVDVCERLMHRHSVIKTALESERQSRAAAQADHTRTALNSVLPVPGQHLPDTETNELEKLEIIAEAPAQQTQYAEAA